MNIAATSACSLGSETTEVTTNDTEEISKALQQEMYS